MDEAVRAPNMEELAINDTQPYAVYYQSDYHASVVYMMPPFLVILWMTILSVCIVRQGRALRSLQRAMSVQATEYGVVVSEDGDDRLSRSKC